MKYASIFIAIAISFTFCKDKDLVPVTPTIPTCCGTVSAKFNGVDWTAVTKSKSGDPSKPGTFHLIFGHYENNYLTQELYLLNLLGKKGTYFPQVQNFNMVNDTTLSSKILYEDYDLIFGAYDKTKGRDDFFAVDSFNAATNYFKGRFEMTYLVRNRPFPTAPDTIHLTDGVFEVNGER